MPKKINRWEARAEQDRQREAAQQERWRQERKGELERFVREHVMDKNHQVRNQMAAAIHAIAATHDYVINAATEGGEGEGVGMRLSPRKFHAWSGWSRRVGALYINIEREPDEWEADFTRPVWTLKINEQRRGLPHVSESVQSHEGLTLLEAFARAEEFVRKEARGEASPRS